MEYPIKRIKRPYQRIKKKLGKLIARNQKYPDVRIENYKIEKFRNLKIGKIRILKSEKSKG